MKYDPDILWFDTPHKLPLYLNVRILEAIREIDKNSKIVINGRLARWGNKNLGDYSNTGDRAAFSQTMKLFGNRFRQPMNRTDIVKLIQSVKAYLFY